MHELLLASNGLPNTWRDYAGAGILLALVLRFLAPIIRDVIKKPHRKRADDFIETPFDRELLNLARQIAASTTTLERWHSPEGADQRQDWKGIGAVLTEVRALRSDIAHLRGEVNRRCPRGIDCDSDKTPS